MAVYKSCANKMSSFIRDTFSSLQWFSVDLSVISI